MTREKPSFAAFRTLHMRVRVSEPSFSTLFMVWLRVRVMLGRDVRLACAVLRKNVEEKNVHGSSAGG